MSDWQEEPMEEDQSYPNIPKMKRGEGRVGNPKKDWDDSIKGSEDYTGSTDNGF